MKRYSDKQVAIWKQIVGIEMFRKSNGDRARKAANPSAFLEEILSIRVKHDNTITDYGLLQDKVNNDIAYNIKLVLEEIDNRKSHVFKKTNFPKTKRIRNRQGDAIGNAIGNSWNKPYSREQLAKWKEIVGNERIRITDKRTDYKYQHPKLFEKEICSIILDAASAERSGARD